MNEAAPAGQGVITAVAGGLSAMLGAGMAVGLATAASAAGWWMLAATAVAGVIALCTALPMANQSGTGADLGYRQVRQRLGALPGRMTGSAALVGRVLAGAAVAGAFGAHVLPRQQLVAVLGVVLLACLLDAVGLRPPPLLTGLLVGFVLVVLGLFVAVCFAIAPAPPAAGPLPAGTPGINDPGGIPVAAGVMFFAFLGFEQAFGRGRPRAAVVPTLLLALVAYLAVGVAALRQLGGPRLALSPAPLRSALAAADASALDGLVTAAVAVATFTVLLALLGSLRRTMGAMAECGDLPVALADQGRRVPVPAALLGGLAVASTAALLDPAWAIGGAACLMLVHYTFTNASLLLSAERSWSRRGAGLGLVLSAVVGAILSVHYLVFVPAVLVAGTIAATLSAHRARR